MTSKAIYDFQPTSSNWDHWCVWQVHCPLFEWSCKETCWCVCRPQGTPVAPPGLSLAQPMAVVNGNAASIYWPVCKFDLILPVPFLVAFVVLTTITACHLPLYRCVAIAFRIHVLSVRFIVPSVVQCYLMHWLNNLVYRTAMIRVQRGVMFHKQTSEVFQANL